MRLTNSVQEQKFIAIEEIVFFIFYILKDLPCPTIFFTLCSKCVQSSFLFRRTVFIHCNDIFFHQFFYIGKL